MTDPYVGWLISVYTEKVGRPPTEPEVAASAAAILRSHASRMPTSLDFVPLVAAETAERLSDPERDTNEPFLQILGKAADAVRHRIVRDAERWRAHLDDPNLVSDRAAPDLQAVEEVKAELLEGLSIEEKLVIEQLIAEQPVVELASRLGVSRRTLYRRLADVKRKIAARI